MRKKKQSDKKKGRGPGLSKRPDRIESERKLIEAGTAVFSEYGYEGASIQKISQLSGVNVSLVNRYFGGKEGLLYEIAKQYAARPASREFGYPPQDTVYDELLEYAKAEFADNIKHKDIIRVLIGRASVDETFRKEMISQIPTDDIDPFLASRLKRLQAMGKIRKDVKFEEVQFVIGFQFFATIFLSHMILEFEKDKTEALLESFIETYAKGLA